MNPLTQNSPNPLLARLKLPGKVFQLPSKGLLYPKGVLADTVLNGEVEVKAMSALTELKVRTADLIYSGKVLAEVCKECAPEILQPNLLVAKDVDALFCFLVIATYGNFKKIKSIHSCEKADWHEYEVDLDQIISNPNNDALNHKELLFTCQLDNGQVVELAPMTYETSLMLMNQRQELTTLELNESKLSPERVEKLVLNDLMSVVAAVIDSSGPGDPVKVTNRKHIEEWIRSLPKTLTDQITEASNRAHEWGFRFEVPITCKDCGETYQHDLELNPVTFFSG